MVLEIDTQEKMELILKFLEESEIAYCTLGEILVRKKQDSLKKSLQEVTERYCREFQKYSKFMPEVLKCICNPKKFAVEVYDKQGNRLTLKENGQLQAYYSVVRHLFRKYQSDVKEEGVESFVINIQIVD